MWTGNALTAEAPALPWLLMGGAAEVSETLKAVQASLPEEAIVVPGHGRPVGRDGFTGLDRDVVEPHLGQALLRQAEDAEVAQAGDLDILGNDSVQADIGSGIAV